MEKMNQIFQITKPVGYVCAIKCRSFEIIKNAVTPNAKNEKYTIWKE